MTRGEAIQYLQYYKNYKWTDDEAIDMAISALSAEQTLSNMPTPKEPTPIYDYMVGKTKPSDLISRAEVMERLQDFCNWCKDGRLQGAEFVLDCFIPNTPSVSAERVGVWIKSEIGKYYKEKRLECSVCGFVCCVNDLEPFFHYCPSCGARMENKR